MNKHYMFYLCPLCFEVATSTPEVHHHQMIQVDPAEINDRQRKPVMDEAGRLLSHAPRWFLEATRLLRSPHHVRGTRAL